MQISVSKKGFAAYILRAENRIIPAENRVPRVISDKPEVMVLWYRLIPVCFSAALFAACMNESAPAQEAFQAKVLGKGLDCGGTFLIRFTENSGEFDAKLDKESIPASETGIYYADGLPEAYQVENLDIHIGFRKPSENEAYPCTALGPAYHHIIVTSTTK